MAENGLLLLCGKILINQGSILTILNPLGVALEHGFTNSKPMSLSDALISSQNGTTINTKCGTIVFSPVKELPNDFINELTPLMNAFPCENEASPIAKKFTLTIASEGFGIGMHVSHSLQRLCVNASLK